MFGTYPILYYRILGSYWGHTNGSYQEHKVEDRQTFQYVGKRRLQIQMFVGKYKQTENVS